MGFICVCPPWYAQPAARPRRGMRGMEGDCKRREERAVGAGPRDPQRERRAARCPLCAGAPGPRGLFLFWGGHVLAPRHSSSLALLAQDLALLPRDAFILKILPSKGPSLLAVRERGHPARSLHRLCEEGRAVQGHGHPGFREEEKKMWR